MLCSFLGKLKPHGVNCERRRRGGGNNKPNYDIYGLSQGENMEIKLGGDSILLLLHMKAFYYYDSERTRHGHHHMVTIERGGGGGTQRATKGRPFRVHLL